VVRGRRGAGGISSLRFPSLTLARVELDREPARVAQRLWRAPLVDDRAEAHDDGGLHPRPAEQVTASEVRNVVCGLKITLGRGAAGCCWQKQIL
jgi:hypothetical protein